MKRAFKTGFDNYVCEGDKITGKLNGFDLTARIVRDEDSHIDDDDTHNVNRKVTGCNAKQQRHLLEARKAWENNQWFYCGIVIAVSFNGVGLDKHAASLWSIEANYPQADKRRKKPNLYLLEVANELAQEAVDSASKRREEMLTALAH